MIDHRQQMRGVVVALHRQQLHLQLRHPFALGADLGLSHLRRIEQCSNQVLAHARGQLPAQAMRQAQVQVGRQPEAQAELGVVLEQRVRPGRAAPLVVLRPWGDRRVAAIDRRAAGGVGHLHAVAKELAEQAQVRRFATACAGAGKLEQGLQELHAAHVAEVDAGAVVHRQSLEEGDVLAFVVQDGGLVGHVERLGVGLDAGVRRTGLDAQAATRAVLQVDLQREVRARVATRVDRLGLKALRRAVGQLAIKVSRTNHAVWTDEAALSALDAQI